MRKYTYLEFWLQFISNGGHTKNLDVLDIFNDIETVIWALKEIMPGLLVDSTAPHPLNYCKLHPNNGDLHKVQFPVSC